MREFLLFFEVNIICILVLGIIGLNINHSEYSPGRRPRVMLKIIFTTVAFYILDILGGYVRLDSPDPNSTAIFILTAAYFLTFALSSYNWFFYSEILHNKDFFDHGKKHILLVLPIVALFVLLVISYFNGCLFSVTDERGYERGSLFLLQAGISFSYILAAGIRCAYFAKKNKKASNYLDLVTFSTCSFILLLCGGMQFWIGRFPIMIIGETVSILLLYLHYLRNMISLDPLTQIPNRRKLLYQTTEEEKSLRQDEDLYFMFVDIDGFKSINDRYGHIEGDRVLSDISYVIRRFCKKNNCICGRYGGDEFAVVQKINKSREFNSPKRLYELFTAKNITTKDGVPITFSIGYTKYFPGDEIYDLISRADKHMYQAKRSRKSGGKKTPYSTFNEKSIT